MADYRMIVLSNAQEGREDEFDDWYENRHLDDVLNVPGFHRAQRLTTETAIPGAPPEFAHATIYDFVSDDLARTMGYFLSITNTDKMPITSAMGKKSAMYVCRVSSPARVRDVPTPWPD